MKKLENLIRTFSRLSIIALLAVLVVLLTPLAVYFANGIEMLWLVNTAVVLAAVAIATFAVFVTAIIVMHVRERRESDETLC